MPLRCCVPGCKSESGREKGISFHSFPSNAHLRNKWISNVARPDNVRTGKSWEPSGHTKVCSKHFTDSCFSISTTKKILLPNSCPTLFEGRVIPQKIIPKCIVSNTTGKRDIQTQTNPLNMRHNAVKHYSPYQLSSAYASCQKYAKYLSPFKKTIQMQDGSRLSPNIDSEFSKDDQIFALLKERRAYQRSTSKLRRKLSLMKMKYNLITKELKELKSRKEKSTLATSVKALLGARENGSTRASFLVDQIQAFSKRKCSLNEKTLEIFSLLFNRSPKAYRFLRNLNILHVPHPRTLERCPTLTIPNNVPI